MRIAISILAAVAFALVACSDDGDTGDNGDRPTVETPSVQITDTVVGTGDPVQAGDTVTVHYTGTLADGTEFDSSVGGNPFTATLVEGALIAGWVEGIPGMQVGGKRRLIIPSELGYGEAGFGDLIPPGAELTFEIELLSIQ